jgi:hypothetical protein
MRSPRVHAAVVAQEQAGLLGTEAVERGDDPGD